MAVPTPTATDAAAADQVASWRSTDRTGLTTPVMTLTEVEVAELLAARDAVRRAALPLLGVGRADFPLPTLSPRLEGLLAELDGDHGHVVVRGIPVHRLSEADQRLVLWGLGRHLGLPVSQDALGRLVRPADTDRTDFHSGGSDVTALLIRDEGRTVGLVDAQRVVDEVVLRHPYLAVRLFDAWPQDRMGESLPGERPYRSTPLACRAENRLSLRYDRRAIDGAQRFPGVPALAPADVALLDLVDATCAGTGSRELALVEGDLLLVDSYAVLHRHVARTAPASAEPLRLWLTLRHGRTLPGAFTWRTPSYGEPGGRGGVAPRDLVDTTHTRPTQPSHALR